MSICLLLITFLDPVFVTDYKEPFYLLVLGFPAFQLDVAQEPILALEDKSPVAGDWVPVKGHVVVEKIAPLVRPLTKELEKTPVLPEKNVEQDPLVDSILEPEGETPAVQDIPETQEQQDTNEKPEGQIQVEPEAHIEPDVQIEPEVHVEPDVQVEPEVDVEPDVQVEPEDYVESEVHMDSFIEVDQKVYMEPDVQVDPENVVEPFEQKESEDHMVPDVQFPAEQQIDPELEVELTMDEQEGTNEEAPFMEEEYNMVQEPAMNLEPLTEEMQNENDLDQEELTSVEQAMRAEFHGELKEEAVVEFEPLPEEELLNNEPIMELEPPAEDMLTEKDINQEELIPEEVALKAEFQSELKEEPVIELEPLPEEEVFMAKRGNIMAEEPIMELEPEMVSEYTEDQPIMPDGAIMKDEPQIELIGQQKPDLEGQYFLAEEPIVEIESEMLQDPFPMVESGSVMAEEPMMELEPLEGALGEEDMSSAVGVPLYPKPVVGVVPESEMMTLGEEDVEMPVELELQPQHYQKGRYGCTGVVMEGKCYEFFRGPQKAPDAEFFCQHHFPNGHLASITSPFIHRQVMNLMEQKNGVYTRTWVGGLRYLQTGRFIWLDGSHWSYADWLAGEPNDTAGVEDCVELLAQGNGKFNDMPCWDLRAFICSYPY